MAKGHNLPRPLLLAGPVPSRPPLSASAPGPAVPTGAAVPVPTAAPVGAGRPLTLVAALPAPLSPPWPLLGAVPSVWQMRQSPWGKPCGHVGTPPSCRTGA